MTASTLLARAAQVDGLQVSSLDVTGLSQKYGGVQSHIRLAPPGSPLPASRIAPGQAAVLIGCDLLVAAEADVQRRLATGAALAVLNTGVSPSADFTRDPDWQSDAGRLRQRLDEVCAAVDAANATAIAERLLGDAIGANLLLVGMAWQRGWLPVSRQAIEQVIGQQGGARLNLRAFQLGRRAAHDAGWAASFEAPLSTAGAQPIQLVTRQPRSLDQWLALHHDQLIGYQGAALAQRHASRVRAIAAAERAAGHGQDRLAIAVARGYHKLLAHKDEFEVARLLVDPAFRRQLEGQFEGQVRFHLHLGGGALARRDPVTGRPLKREVKGWIWPVLHALAALRRVRGSWLDPWRNGDERRLARTWLSQYEADLDTVQAALTTPVDATRHAALCRLARVPDLLRGYGHVRERSVPKALAERAAALDALAPAPAAEPARIHAA